VKVGANPIADRIPEREDTGRPYHPHGANSVCPGGESSHAKALCR
jgi:hypothetical protein